MSRLMSVRKTEAGFTLIEIMAAAAILTVGILSVMVVFNATLNAQSNTKVRTLATNLAGEKIEAARVVGYDNLTQAYLEANLGVTATKGGATFTIAYSITYIDDPADGSGSGDRNPNDFKRLLVTVSWTNPTPASSVVLETLVNSNPVYTEPGNLDTQAPVWPNGGNVLVGSAQQLEPGLGMYVWWLPNWATDNVGVVGYLVYRKPPGDTNFLLVVTEAPTVGWFLDNYYDAGGTYEFYAKAFDAAGNISTASNTVTVVGPADIVAPSVPTGLSLTSGSTPAVLSWLPSSDNSGAIDHYNIYRTLYGDPFGDTPYGSSIEPPFNDYGQLPGTTYEYCVTAVDPSNNESGRSNRI